MLVLVYIYKSDNYSSFTAQITRLVRKDEDEKDDCWELQMEIVKQNPLALLTYVNLNHILLSHNHQYALSPP